MYFSRSVKAINLNLCPERLEDSSFITVGKEFKNLEELITSFASDEIIQSTGKQEKSSSSTWLERMLKFKKTLYDTDRTSLIDDTHLDKYVSTSWQGKIIINPTYRRSLCAQERRSGKDEGFTSIPIPCKRLKSVGDIGGPYTDLLSCVETPLTYISAIPTNATSLRCHQALLRNLHTPQNNYHAMRAPIVPPST